MDALGRPVMVAFFGNGRLLGVVRTNETSNVGPEYFPGIPSDTPNVLFAGIVPRLRAKFETPADFWVIAISESGYFARLGYRPGPSEVQHGFGEYRKSVLLGPLP